MAADDVALRLGVAGYSLRHFPREKAIEMTKALGTLAAIATKCYEKTSPWIMIQKAKWMEK